MKASLKLMFGAAALIAGALSAQEPEVKDFVANPALWLQKSPNIQKTDDGLLIKGRAMLYTAKFAVDPAKTYTVKFEASSKQADGKPSWVLIGFDVYGKDGKQITSSHVGALKGTLTTVVEDAPKGATVIKLKDASKFRKVSAVVAFDAKEDFSDLPNYNIAAVKDIAKNGDVWEITLAKPLAQDVKAGTSVREHGMGGYLYTATPNVKAELVSKTGTLKGIAKSGWLGSQWPAGTATVRFLLLVNWSSAPGMETLFKTISLTIE
ncbi:MAG: hypothetical protein IJS14_04975 [Lentisphaeria bacterium]|nr:hypothetical protein [Lentisphaeria bacterium]